ncbi:MAG: trypsin-like serine protease [Rhodobacteraceae bacterium]|nr:trypsin-like serine protease [Paracoccaceae bacterium]
MVTETEQANWLAVGRLNVSGQGYCTATLIAPDLVMTAAHCVVDRRSGAPVDATRIHFLAGFRLGGYAAHGRAHSVTVVPGFDRAARDVARDLALVRLSQPIGNGIRPIPLGSGVRPDVPLQLVSYGIDRSQIASMERGCRYEARSGTILFTDCEGVPGVSGAPLLQKIDGHLTAIGVASAVITPKRGGLARGAVLAVEATRSRVSLLGRLPGTPETLALYSALRATPLN